MALLSTGDEVVEPSTERLGPGQIRDANRSMLLAAAASAGAETVDLGIARDTEGDVEACFDRAVAARVDVLITTGGFRSRVNKNPKTLTLNPRIRFFSVNPQTILLLGHRGNVEYPHHQGQRPRTSQLCLGMHLASIDREPIIILVFMANETTSVEACHSKPLISLTITIDRLPCGVANN